MTSQSTIEAKQEYLRQNILEKGYDANLFADYLITKKGERGADIASWSMEDLIKVVQEFTEKQSSFLSGGDNLIPHTQNSDEISEEKIEEPENKKEDQNEAQIQQKDSQEIQDIPNINQKKINPHI